MKRLKVVRVAIRAGDAEVATITERIANRGSQRRGWPAWSRPALLTIPMLEFVAVLYWALPVPGLDWLAWFWTLYPFAFLFAVWVARITAIDIGPDLIAVRRPIRSQVAAMKDVLRVDARRSAWRFLAKGQPAPFTVDVWLTGRRHWRLDNVEPEAGDQILASLHRHNKPIWVYTSG